MNGPMQFGEPTEVADGIFCIPTDYPAVADAPLWTHLIRGDVSTLVDCGVPTIWWKTLDGRWFSSSAE